MFGQPVNQSEISIVLYQPIRDQNSFVSTNQKSVLPVMKTESLVTERTQPLVGVVKTCVGRNSLTMCISLALDRENIKKYVSV